MKKEDLTTPPTTDTPATEDAGTETVSVSYEVFFDYVALKQAQLPDRIGSLVIPERAKQAQPFGEVVEVGPEVKAVNKGDKVFFDDRHAVGIPYDGEFLLVVKEDNLRCRVVGDFTDSEIVIAGLIN